MATGQGSPLTPDLARALTPVAKSIVEPLRQYGVYAAEVEPGPDADDAAALLGYLGRSPAWAALKPHASRLRIAAPPIRGADIRGLMRRPRRGVRGCGGCR